MLFISSKNISCSATKGHSSLTWTSGALLVIYGNHKFTQNFWGIFLEGSDFCIGIIHHEVIMASASLIEAWSSDWHMNSVTTLYPTLVCTQRKKNWNCFVVLYVTSIRASSLPYLSSICCCHGFEGFLSSSRSWFIFFGKRSCFWET